MTSFEIKFEEWQWEEEISILSLEDVGLGIVGKLVILSKIIILLALIINFAGLGISTVVFVIEKMFYEIKRK